ncbi:hypothetical protein H9L39_01403, partial [Fusarium oxysporum f. sp. albedinis]
MDDEQRTIEKQYPRQGSALSFGANKGAGATASFFVAFKCGSEKVMCVQQVLATNVPSPIPLPSVAVHGGFRCSQEGIIQPMLTHTCLSLTTSIRCCLKAPEILMFVKPLTIANLWT